MVFNFNRNSYKIIKGTVKKGKYKRLKRKEKNPTTQKYPIKKI
jgi:hypothetical protein